MEWKSILLSRNPSFELSKPNVDYVDFSVINFASLDVPIRNALAKQSDYYRILENKKKL